MNLIDILLHHLGLHVPLALEPDERSLAAMAFVAMLIATTIHGFGHALMADRLGDGTPRAQKRLSLSPLAHLDPLGIAVMIVTSLIGFPIGWGGRPVRTNPENFRCGAKRGMGLVALAGPMIVRWILRGGLGSGEGAIWTLLALCLLMIISLSLFAFNVLVPISPLDGAYILASVLPDPFSEIYRAFMARFGSYLLIGLMYSRALGNLIAPLIIWLFWWLIGIR
jgi:Zn-dependent protease